MSKPVAAPSFKMSNGGSGYADWITSVPAFSVRSQAPPRVDRPTRNRVARLGADRWSNCVAHSLRGSLQQQAQRAKSEITDANTFVVSGRPHESKHPRVQHHVSFRAGRQGAGAGAISTRRECDVACFGGALRSRWRPFGVLRDAWGLHRNTKEYSLLRAPPDAIFRWLGLELNPGMTADGAFQTLGIAP
jgi:hypothetical protein